MSAIKTRDVMGIVMRMLAVGWWMSLAAMCCAQTGSPAPVPPTFIAQDPTVIYYRPVVNALGTTAIFEHTLVAGGMTTLYSLDLASPNAMPQPFITSVGATRPDWCWNRTGGALTVGPIAFSNGNGVYILPVGSSSPTLLPNTMGMIYPSWYPDCLHMATDVGTTHVTAEIDTAGNTIIPQLGNSIRSGFRRACRPAKRCSSSRRSRLSSR
jgi:hypothetical protein